MAKGYVHLIGKGQQTTLLGLVDPIKTRCGSMRLAILASIEGVTCPRCIAGHSRDEAAMASPSVVLRPTLAELKIRAATDKRLRRRLRNLASGVTANNPTTTSQFRATIETAELLASNPAESSKD